MSTRHRHSPRRARRAAGALLAATIAGSVGLVSSVAAQPPPQVTSFSADAARRSGRAISAMDVDVDGQRLVSVSAPAGPDRVPSTGREDAGAAEGLRREAMRLLDVAGDGTLAIARAVADPTAGLVLATPSGAQAVVSLPGVAGAAFAADGWAAAVDGSGRLWRVDQATGTATVLADGPFAGNVAFRRGGALLLVALPSMEAPFSAALVELDPESGRVRGIAGGDSLGLVLAAGELADGAIGVVAHHPGGGVAYLRLADGVSSTVATLDPDAVDVSLSADGAAVAYARADGASFLLRPGGDRPASLGRGALPRVSSDGRAVALLRDGQTVVVDADGHEVHRVSSLLAAWARPAESCGGCQS